MTDVLTPQEIAARVLDDIKTHGHFQADSETDHTYWTVGDNGPCCLLVNPTVAALYADDSSDTVESYKTALRTRLNVERDGDVVDWNDTHDSDEVLGLLNDIAAGR